MTQLATNTEGDWLASLDPGKKARFLAALGHWLTVAGRGSYAAKGVGLTHPENLRQINEIQHRVLGCLNEVLSGTNNANFQRSIAGWVLEASDVALREQTTWAWESAKKSLAHNAT